MAGIEKCLFLFGSQTLIARFLQFFKDSVYFFILCFLFCVSIGIFLLLSSKMGFHLGFLWRRFVLEQVDGLIYESIDPFGEVVAFLE